MTKWAKWSQNYAMKDNSYTSTSESSLFTCSSNMAFGSFILLLLDCAIWRFNLHLISSSLRGLMLRCRNLDTTSAAVFFHASTITFICKTKKYIYIEAMKKSSRNQNIWNKALSKIFIHTELKNWPFTEVCLLRFSFIEAWTIILHWHFVHEIGLSISILSLWQFLSDIPQSLMECLSTIVHSV